MRVFTFLLSATLTCAAAPVAADIILQDAGIACPAAHLTGQPSETLKSGDTVSALAEGTRIEFTTDDVPEINGLLFGIAIRNTDRQGARTLLLDLSQPAENGGRSNDSYSIRLPAQETYLDTWTLSKDTTSLRGAWTFRVLSGGQVLVKQTFSLVGPTDVPEVTRFCAEHSD